jgi:GNAT superfamily N-acetyltransferase
MFQAGGIEYRPAAIGDLPQITNLICSSEEHGIIDASAIRGAWFVAAQGDKVVGCIWCFSDGYNAFWDYLYIRPEFRNGRIALVLGRQFENFLRTHGVRRIISTMKTDNKNVIRMALASGHAVDRGYELGYKELRDGN